MLYGPLSAGLAAKPDGQEFGAWIDRMGYSNLVLVYLDNGSFAPKKESDADGAFVRLDTGIVQSLTHALALGPAFTLLTTVVLEDNDFLVLGVMLPVMNAVGDHWRLEQDIGTQSFKVFATIDGVLQTLTFTGVRPASGLFILGLRIDAAMGAVLWVNGVVYVQRWATAGAVINTHPEATLKIGGYESDDGGGDRSAVKTVSMDMRDFALAESALSSAVIGRASRQLAADYGIGLAGVTRLLVWRIDDWTPSVPTLGPYGQSRDFILENIGVNALTWEATFENPFLGPDPIGQYVTLRPDHGTLRPGEKVTVRALINLLVTIDASLGIIHFVNTQNGVGNDDALVIVNLT